MAANSSQYKTRINEFDANISQTKQKIAEK